MNNKKTILIIFAAIIVFAGFGFAREVSAALIYSWSCTGGSLDNPNIAQPTYTASQVSSDTTYTCTLTVTDSSTGLSDSDTMNVLVKESAPNNPPTVINLWETDPDWCVNPFQFNLNWTFSDFDGDNQYAKWIQADDNPSFTSIDHDSGKVENNAIPAYTTFLTDGKGGVLQFNKTYYWRVKVWDSKGGESGWITSSQSLITPEHAYPDPDFTFEPSRPRELQTVQFTDQSYSPVSIARWLWIFEDGNPLNSNQQNPTNIFETPGSKDVFLTVWDEDNYSCSGDKGAQVVPVGLFAPVWREIIPW
jgi:hypothetical protein